MVLNVSLPSITQNKTELYDVYIPVNKQKISHQELKSAFYCPTKLYNLAINAITHLLIETN